MDDAATQTLMTELYRGLLAGAPPAATLAAAQAAASAEQAASAASFICLGAG